MFGGVDGGHHVDVGLVGQMGGKGYADGFDIAVRKIKWVLVQNFVVAQAKAPVSLNAAG